MEELGRSADDRTRGCGVPPQNRGAKQALETRVMEIETGDSRLLTSADSTLSSQTGSGQVGEEGRAQGPSGSPRAKRLGKRGVRAKKLGGRAVPAINS